MSRLGKLPIKIPAGTEVAITPDVITVKGPKGQLQQATHPQVSVVLREAEGGKEVAITVTDAQDRRQRALWGLYRVLIQNMVDGVNAEFTKQLEVNGVGYRVSVSGNTVVLNVGYSHPVEFALPDGIKAAVEKNVLTLTGINKQVLGETAAQIRRVRKPEPYKGKGIKYIDEIIRRKAGKTASS